MPCACCCSFVVSVAAKVLKKVFVFVFYSVSVFFFFSLHQGFKLTSLLTHPCPLPAEGPLEKVEFSSNYSRFFGFFSLKLRNAKSLMPLLFKYKYQN